MIEKLELFDDTITLIVIGAYVVYLFLNWKEAKQYIRLGVFLGLSYFFLHILHLFLLVSVVDEPHQPLMTYIQIFSNPLIIIIFVCVGMTICREGQLAGIYFVRGQFRQDKSRKDIFRGLGWIFLATIGIIIWTWILFSSVGLRESRIFEDQSSVKLSWRLTFNILTIKQAFLEEIFYRLGMQTLLWKLLKSRTRHAYLIAVLITSCFWAIGHWGVVEPNWIKLLHVFAIGIVLGFLFKKYGLEGSFFAHVVSNLVL